MRFAAALHSQQVDGELTTLHAQIAAKANPQGFVIYRLGSGVDPVQAAARMRSLSGVADAGALHYRYLLATPIPTITPNDPDLGTQALATQSGGDTTNKVQWDMFFTQLPQAWANFNTGSSSLRIAIIDTGYDMNNTDLASKVDLSAVFDSGTGQQPTCVGVTAQDNDGHGSNVSGIAAAVTNNLSRVAGVAWQTHLIEARVFPYPVGTATPNASTTDIAAAINWAVSHSAKVISLSLGGPCPDDPVEASAIAAAITAGVTVVAASGNDATNSLLCPAGDTGVIAVGASALDSSATVTEKIASYSNWGSSVGNLNSLDVVAPGGDPTGNTDPDFLHWILNLYSSTASPPGSEALFAGTSQATPHVAGVAALMYVKHGTITPSMIKSILDTNANNDDICSGCAKEGHGRLNAYKALLATP